MNTTPIARSGDQVRIIATGATASVETVTCLGDDAGYRYLVQYKTAYCWKLADEIEAIPAGAPSGTVVSGSHRDLVGQR